MPVSRTTTSDALEKCPLMRHCGAVGTFFPATGVWPAFFGKGEASPLFLTGRGRERLPKADETIKAKVFPSMRMS